MEKTQKERMRYFKGQEEESTFLEATLTVIVIGLMSTIVLYALFVV